MKQSFLIFKVPGAPRERRRLRERRRPRRHLGAPTSRRPVREATARRRSGFFVVFPFVMPTGTSAFPRVPTRRRRSREGADGDVGIPQGADETSAFPGRVPTGTSAFPEIGGFVSDLAGFVKHGLAGRRLCALERA
jgi:hypothetical protein